jgi:hypothetical protein
MKRSKLRMGRIRPMASAFRRGGLAGSQLTAEASRPATVRLVAEAARQLALAGAACTGCTVTTRAARAVARPVTALWWTGRCKVGSASTLTQRRRRRARGKGAGLILAAA